MPAISGHGLAMSGDGTFTNQTFPHTSVGPPNFSFDGLLWFRVPDGKMLFWSESDGRWFYVDRKKMTFNGGGAGFNSAGCALSDGFTYRTMGWSGVIESIWIEAQGTVQVSLDVDGVEVELFDCNGFLKKDINVKVGEDTKIRMYQKDGRLQPFVAELSIRIMLQ
jgi:hypothetical protein